MATLIKANNTTALNLAGSWSPAQIPTSVDVLSFTSTYNIATAATLNIGATLTVSQVAVGAITDGFTATTLILGVVTGLPYPVTLDTIDLSAVNTNVSVLTGLTSTGTLTIRHRAGYSLTLEPTDTNISVTSAFETGSQPSLSIYYPASVPGISNYQLPGGTNTVTVAATEDALISFEQYPNANIYVSGATAVITGHPTLPTALTLECTFPAFGGFIPATTAANNSNGNGSSTSIRAIVQDDSGDVYIGSPSAFTDRGYYFIRYRPSAQKIITTLPLGGEVYALAKDPSGNIIVLLASGAFVPVISTTYGQEYGIARYNPTTNQWTSVGGGFASGTTLRALAIDASGNIYVGGSFTSTRSGVSANYIAKFTVSTGTWSALGTGANSIVYAATMAGNDLYIAGSFTTVGGVSTSRFAKWTPSTSTWSSVTMPTSNASYASTLAYDSVANKLYAGTNTGNALGPSNTSPLSVYDVGTSTWSNLIPASNTYNYCTSLKIDTTARKLYCGFNYFGVNAAQVQVFDIPTSTFTSLGLALSNGCQALGLLTGNDLWVGFNGISTNQPTGFSARSIIRYNTSTSTLSLMSYVDQTVESIPYNLFYIYSGSTTSGTLLKKHVFGKTTYVVAPNTTVCVEAYCGAAAPSNLSFPPVIRVRRGGALLESPTLSTDSSVQIAQRSLLDYKFTGSTVNVTLPSASVALATPALSTSATESRIYQSTGPTSATYLRLNSRSTRTILNRTSTVYSFTVLGELPNTTTFTGSFIAASVQLGLSSLYGTTLMTQPFVFGAPRDLTDIYIARALSLSNSYTRISGTLTLDSAKPVLYAPAHPFTNALLASASTNYKVIEWTTSSDVILVGYNYSEFRVSSFNTFSYLGLAQYVYSGVNPITITKPLLPLQGNSQSAVIVMESGSGALTLNTYYSAASPFTVNQQEVAIYNNALNVFTGDISPTRLITSTNSLNYLRVGGTGTLSINSYLMGVLTVFTGATGILDFSAPTAPVADLVYPYSTFSTTSGLNINSGTLQIKGSPGQTNSQYLGGYFVGNDAYLQMNLNGATSLTLNVYGIQGGPPNYISGLSANSSVYVRTTNYGTNGTRNDQNNLAPAVILLGSTPGTADFADSAIVGPLIPYTGYVSALPATGGNSSSSYTLTSGLVLSGNVSAWGVKVTQATSSDVLDLNTFNLQPRTFLLTGNLGGTYTMAGPLAGSNGCQAYNICNCSNAELQLVTSLTYSAVVLSGPGILSLGSPTTTYRSTIGSTVTFSLYAAEVRLYAGTDNLTPFLTAGGSIFVLRTLRLMGSGTGRNVDTYTLYPGSKLQVDEDWSASGLSFSGSNYHRRYEVNVAATKTFIVNTLPLLTQGRLRKTGAGTMRILYTNTNTANSSLFWYVEQGVAELSATTFIGLPVTPITVELLAGAILSYNSTYNFDGHNVTFGAGQVVKNNINTIAAKCRNSFTGGFIVNAGEWDAQYRYAVGDGNVTLSGGTLRASDVETDPYALEVAGNLVFAGGTLVIGAAYVA